MMPENDNPSPSTMTYLPAPRAKRASPWLFVALAALALAGWQWFETRQKLVDVQQQVSQKLAEFDTGNKEDRGAQKQSREQVEALQARLGAVDGKIAEFQAQSATLQALYQDIARSREELALIEVEQALIARPTFPCARLWPRIWPASTPFRSLICRASACVWSSFCLV